MNFEEEEEEELSQTTPSNSAAEGEVLRTIPLLNAMVDVALVLGFDETCSQELRVSEDEKEEEVREGHGRFLV